MAGPKKPEAPKSASGIELIVFLILLTAIIPIIGRLFVSNFSPLEFLLGIREYFTPFFEKYLIWLKIISVILSALFIWGIVHILIITNYFIDARGEDILDFLGKDYKFKLRMYLNWRTIQKNLNSSDPKNWKRAVVDSENILNNIFKMSGYLGSKLDDKFPLITPAQLSNIEDVKRAHDLWKKISGDPAAKPAHEQVKEIIEVFKKSFIELGLLSED